jgi:hypothetical protein
VGKEQAVASTGEETGDQSLRCSTGMSRKNHVLLFVLQYLKTLFYHNSVVGLRASISTCRGQANWKRELLFYKISWPLQSLEDEQAARAEMEAALESLQEAVEEPNSKDQTGAMEDQHLVKQNADV